MKSSLKKLRGLAGHHKRVPTPRPAAFHLDDLAQASKDMQDMRNCYDSLLSAAAATANSAYEFSEALREMGSCLLEKTALNEDEESGRILLMLGKAQFELQKLVNSYRAHIIQTITTPSESLLNELKTVEDMKRQCDDKREVFDYILATQKERSKSKNSKGESFSPQQLQAAREEYDNEATLFVFRLKSLRQGQSRSLLTQAARHHAAQLNFFRKGNISLEAIEPYVKLIAEKQHIDYHFSGLEDDGTEEDYGYDVIDDGELSFDYGEIEQGPEVVSTYRSSMELDQTDQTSIPVSTLEIAQESLVNRQPDYFPFVRGSRSGSRSEPIFPDKKLEQVEKLERRPSSKKFHTYVLPTPVDSKGSNIASSGPIPIARQQSTGGLPTQFWHSSPLGPEKSADEKSLFPTQSLKVQSVLQESNTNSETPKIPPPLAEGFSFSRLNTNITSDNKKIKRQVSLSGPLMSKALPGKPIYAPMMSTAPLHVPKTKPSASPRASPSASPPRMSSPRISELHELPRPPLSSGKITRPPSLIGHSAPLVPRGSELSGTIKALPVSSHMAAPLPVPPGTIARSFSIPSSSQRAPSTVNKLLDSRNMNITDRAASPPLTPISLSLRPEPRRASVSDVQAIKPTSES